MTKATTPDPEPGANLTLDELSDALGPADTDLLAAVVDEASRADLIKLGAEIASARVLTDDRRIYGRAYGFWTAASEGQRATLVGFSPELLALAVDRAIALRELNAAAAGAGHGDGAEHAARDQAAAASFAKALTLRDQAAKALTTVAGRDTAFRARVKASVGTAEDSDALARGLESLAAIGTTFLAHKKDAVAGRVKLARLSKAYVDGLTAAAKDVRSTGRAASAPSQHGAGQGDIDLLDGVNLHLLGDVIHAFEGAHDVDPTIPRLVPIATRRLLGASGRRAKAADPAPVPEPLPTPPQTSG